jgi:hypothetical protein
MTIKQQKAVKNMGENGGNVSKAMIDAGYSPATAKNPEKLTKSKNYTKLIQKILKPTKVLKTIDQSMDANKVISAQVFPDGKNGKPINDFIEVPDWQNRLKGADQAADMLRMKPQKEEIPTGGVHFHAHIEQQKEKYGL